ncbi:MAG: response regulator [Polyangiaceae bacterium]|nr:response regulator [Polyangiaceae bacterium]MCB9606481.1 response regulator [Polyangiaceae bacterium]
MNAVPDATHGKRILVVDDVEMSRRVVARMLSHAGYEPICVHSGGTALACLERAHFDGMVLDLKMPGMNGWQVLYAVRTLAPDLPIVLHSAHELTDPVLMTDQVCFLRKPYRPGDLQAALERVL